MTDFLEEREINNLRHKTLSVYHSRLYTLLTFLNSIRQHNDQEYDKPILKSSDSSTYKNLLENTICTFRSLHDESQLRKKLKNCNVKNGLSQQEIIDLILRDLSKSYEKNVLITGNKFPSIELPINISRPNVDNRHVNSPSSVLRGKEWRLLRARIGDEAFRLILTSTSLFLPIGNNCFIQLSGTPIYDLYDHSKIAEFDDTLIKDGTETSHEVDEGVVSGCRGKKRKRKMSAIDGGMKQKSPVNAKGTADIKIPRQRIYYGRPARTSNGKIMYGLPPTHTLHKLSSMTGHLPDIQYLKFAQTVLPSLFHRSIDDRLRVKGNPERIEGILGMVKELVARYRKIDFKDLLRRSRKSNDISVYTTKLSREESNLPVTQALPSTLGSQTDQKLKNVKVHEQCLPPLLEAVPHGQVCRFLTLVFHNLFSKEIMGGQKNHDVISTHIRRFVRMKQYEPVNLHSLVQGVRSKDFEWLTIHSDIKQRVNVTEAEKRSSLAADLVLWIFEGFLIPLLRNTFYITETSTTRYETVFYIHEEWKKATKPHLEGLKTDLLVELNKNESYFAQQGPLGVSAVRLIPKPTGFRPIVNLGKKIKPQSVLGIPIVGFGGKTGMTANQILTGVHKVLTFEKDRHKSLLGASLFGTNEIFTPVQALKSELLAKHTKLPKLYFVKMDIKAAFDTIKQDKMIEVVSSLLDKYQNHDYCLMLYCLLLPPASKASQGAARRLFKSKAVIDGHLASSFGEHAQGIAEPLRNAVIVDLVRRKQITRESCIDLLRTHIQNNVWQVGKNLYKQKIGIPQGSKVSSLLCSFFYSSLENEYLQFTRQEGSRLLRYIDDFLFITDSESLARRFVDIMASGFPSYGAEVSISKTLLSFECETKGQMGSIADVDGDGETLFPYCGFLLNTKTLDIMGDYPRSLSGPVKQSFALRSDRRRGSAFIGWFSRQLENRNQVAYLDTLHNRMYTVHLNIFINFALTSMKIPYYFKSEDIFNAKRDQSIADSLIASAEYTYLAGRARVIHASRADERRDHYGIRRIDFIFLALSAVMRVLRKKTRFKGIVDILEIQLKNKKHRGLRNKLNKVIQKGWEAVEDAQY
ncbi:uncharacterized protein L201_007875 [Kwoniella dendrophila CBS 6074]|uniref:Telomerase reverse transcriptase n=1 Tax=Kwoniella dendrophila CBS 6074 TaxID=1295534 RepID=A0AAX4K751_9TREE